MNASVANAVNVTALHPAPSEDDKVDFQRDPGQYRHWRLSVEGVIATLTLNINEDAGIRPGYKLKLNSYDLGVDIELADLLERVRFEQPGVQVVIVTSGKDRIFCSGANIYMLGTSTHAWKVNFCKFTNETRNGMEHASRHSGLKFIAAVNGACAGGGYELALACDEIVLVDDRSSAVSLPEVPLLGVLPGTGGLTRLIDKRHVRRDRADVFCTTQEGQRAERAKKWNLIDDFAKPAAFAELIQKRAAALAATSTRVAGTTGIVWDPIDVKSSATSLTYPHLDVAIDADKRVATLTLTAPSVIESDPARLVAEGVSWAPLALARELNDAILQLRTNHLEIGTWVLKTRGDLPSVQRMDQLFAELGDHWLVKETVNLWDRVLAKLEVSSRSLLALVDPGSCFAGTFLEIALAADRIYMLQSDDENERTPRIVVTEANRKRYLMVNGQTRLETRFMGDAKALAGALQRIDEPLDASAADDAGLVTFTPDEIDWDDEIRLMIEERASLSPDALTGMEASLRFAGAETMDTRIFARLSAWQNWVFVRPNAVGENGALKIFGTGKRPQFDWRRV